MVSLPCSAWKLRNGWFHREREGVKMTVGEMLTRSAHKFPGKKALVSEDVSLSFETLNERVNSLANALMQRGLNKGDRIGVLVHNCHQFIEIYFAAAKSGGIFCPYNNHLKQWEIKDLIIYSTPRFLFVDPDFGEMINGIKSELTSVEGFISLKKSHLAFMEDYESKVTKGEIHEPAVKVLEDDVQSIIFTAGTTGKPKGAMRTHRHLLSDAVAQASIVRRSRISH
jgi:long-chain acyl-CoA synthetase